jgi:hypothetical protein
MPNRILTGLILSAVLLAALPNAAFASTLMGYFGLTSTQMAAVYVANPLSSFSCRVQIKLVDTQGMTVASQQTMTVAPGTSATLDFTQPTTTTTTIAQNSPANGGPIRAQVSLVEPDSPAMAFLASAEVFDPVSGATTVAWPPSPIRVCRAQ